MSSFYCVFPSHRLFFEMGYLTGLWHMSFIPTFPHAHAKKMDTRFIATRRKTHRLRIMLSNVRTNC
jgi:hypothetical protein